MAGTAEKKLSDLGITLHAPAAAIANYVPFVRTANFMRFLSASAANPTFAQDCRESDCELRVQSGTRIITLLVSFDSEARIGPSRKIGRTSESGH